MQSKFFTSTEEKEKLFCTELVKAGVPFHRAVQVAKTITAGKSDEHLSEEEIRLAKEVCQEWLKQRNRMKSLEKRLESINTQWRSSHLQ
jgi:hypothetical protein